MSSSPIIYIGHYRLINAVYTGQVSRTWQAYDDQNRRSVAIKVLFQSAAKNAEQVNFFKWEYQVGSHYNDDKIIKFYEFGRHGKAPYIAMEWFPAPNVKQLMLNGYGQYCVHLPKLIPGMVNALALFNDGGYIHRDVKPDNFLFKAELGVKLIDFALAKKASGNILAKLLARRDKTQGTASYMSPEQIRGTASDSSSDVYSLGCTFFEILADRLPFTGTSMNDLLQKHISGATPSITARNKNVTPEFSAILFRMMAKRPSDRFKSTRELANALRNVRIFKKTPVEGDEVY